MIKGNKNNKKKQENNSQLSRLLTYTRPYVGYMLAAVLFALISVAFTLLTPILIGQAVDNIVGQGEVDFGRIKTIAIYLLIAVLGSAFFQWSMTYCTNKVTFHTMKDLRTQVHQKLYQVPLKFIDGKAHGDIINSVVNDIDVISDGLLQGFAQLITGIMTIIGTIGFMLSINIQIGLVVIVLTPLSLFVAAFISKRIYSKFSEQSKIRGEMGGFIEEMVGNQKIVKTFSYEDRSMDRFVEVNDRLYQCGVVAQFYSALSNPMTRFINGVVYAAVGIIGAFVAIQGKISIGQLSSFLSYANQYTKPFNEISSVVTELQSAFASARRVFSLLDEEVDGVEEGLRSEIDCKGEVEIEHVYFSYQSDVSLIEDFNLKVNAGQRVAIVGPTGCGKTTIINLLMRFYEINSGKIKIDGVNIRDLERNTLRDLYGMVLQDTWLFHGTVRDNIAYGKPDATDKEIIAAAKASHAHSFIKRLAKGYDTMISEDGGNISQGQKQLLCIARIMLTKPPMLILDEATSNIDTRTEVNIQKAFARLMEGRTSFIVAHRLSTIKEADIILVMNKGKIIEQGNHEELLEQKGFYFNLYNSQFEVE